MHNPHLLGRAGQLCQTYFTHSALILTRRKSASDCQQTMAATVRTLLAVCHVTLTPTPAEIQKLPQCMVYFLV